MGEVMSTFLFIMALVYFILNMIELKLGEITTPSLFNMIGWLGFAIVLSTEVFK